MNIFALPTSSKPSLSAPTPLSSFTSLLPLGKNQYFSLVCQHNTTLADATWKIATPAAIVSLSLEKSANTGASDFGASRGFGFSLLSLVSPRPVEDRPKNVAELSMKSSLEYERESVSCFHGLPELSPRETLTSVYYFRSRQLQAVTNADGTFRTGTYHTPHFATFERAMTQSVFSVPPTTITPPPKR